MLDTLIRNGRIVDGTGNPYRHGDVGICGGRIVFVGRAAKEGISVQRTIDANGAIIAPGFVDPHTHADIQALIQPDVPNLVTQGITTVLTGNCSWGPHPDDATLWDVLARSPFATSLFYVNCLPLEQKWASGTEYADLANRAGVGANLAPLIGYANLRWKAGIHDGSPPSTAQLDEMKAVLRQGLEAGGYGLSVSASYFPSRYATFRELVELSRIVTEYDGLLAFHVAELATPQSVRTAISVAAESGVRLHIPHFNAPRDHWDDYSEMVGIIDTARNRGVDVTFSLIQYHIWALSAEAWRDLSVFSATSFGGISEIRDVVLRNARQVEYRRSLQPVVRAHIAGAADYMWEELDKIGTSQLFLTGNPDVEGRTVDEIADERGVKVHDLAFDLFFGESDIVAEGADPVFGLPFLGSAEAIVEGSNHPVGMPTVDITPNETEERLVRQMPWPSGYGTFPKYFRDALRRGVRMEEAIRHMTSLPASVIGLRDRGLVREGMAADLVVFDSATYSPQVTWKEPLAAASGVEEVLVSGVPVIANGKQTGQRPGRVLVR